MARVAVANTNTYIQGSVEYSAYVSGSDIIVDVTFQMRRTNSYSGDTYSTAATPSIMISGSQTWNYTGSAGVTVRGGQQDVWQTIYTASRTYSSSYGGTTIYVGWKVDNDGSGYLGGSATAAITLPTASTPPTGLSVAVAEIYPTGAKFDVSVSSYGNPSSASGRWIEAGIAGQNAWQNPSLRSAIAENTTSAQIVVDNNSTKTTTLTIQPNTQYYYGGYASNTQSDTSTVSGQLVTLALAPTLSARPIDDSSVLVTYSLQADGGFYAKNVRYSLDGGTTWVTGATINTGSATTGTFTIAGLTPNTAYIMKTKVSTTAGETNGADVAFKTGPSYESHESFYGSTSGVATPISDFLGSVDGSAVPITKFYGSVNGRSKLICQNFGHLSYD